MHAAGSTQRGRLRHAGSDKVHRQWCVVSRWPTFSLGMPISIMAVRKR